MDLGTITLAQAWPVLAAAAATMVATTGWAREVFARHDARKQAFDDKASKEELEALEERMARVVREAFDRLTAALSTKASEAVVTGHAHDIAAIYGQLDSIKSSTIATHARVDGLTREVKGLRDEYAREMGGLREDVRELNRMLISIASKGDK